MIGTSYKGNKDETRSLQAFVKLMRAAESASARVHGHLSGAGLTISQFGVIEALFHLGPLNQGELARKILKSTGNLTMVIDNLEKRGLVRRDRDQKDRRSYVISLTGDGEKLIKLLFPRHAAIIAEDMSILTKSEQETLGNLCRKLGIRKKS